MDQTPSQHDEARIRQRAYEIWMDEGAPSGRSAANWQQAQEELARADQTMSQLNIDHDMSRPQATRRRASR